MNDIAKVDLDFLEPYMLAFSGPQIQFPVVHHFGPGVYIREVTLPKGAMAMGHKQRHKHLNVVLRGSVAIYDDGKAKVISGPLVFVGEPGRKIGVCIEECTWQNVYPNPDNCRDIEALEARWLDKSLTAIEYEKNYTYELSKFHDEDREDYEKLISEIGMTDEQIRTESFSEIDMVDMPEQYATRISVRNSAIEGRGLFLSSPAVSGEIIAPGRIGESRTIAGRYVNHSKAPNCEYKTIGDIIYLIAITDINGSLGGSAGSELTVDYRRALSVAKRMELQ